jgi:hypothetical protein
MMIKDLKMIHSSEIRYIFVLITQAFNLCEHAFSFIISGITGFVPRHGERKQYGTAV